MRHFFFAFITLCSLVMLDACSKNGPTPTSGSSLTNLVKVSNSDLPQAAQDYIVAHYPNATIKEVEKGTEEQSGAQEYSVLLSDGTTLLFDLSGNFLGLDDNHQDGTDGNHEDGDSTNVNDDHNGNHEDGDSTDVNDEHDGDHEDGNVTLPAAAQAWLAANFPGTSVDHAEADTLCDGTALISVSVEQGQNDLDLSFTPDGTFLFKKTELAYANLPPAVKDAVSTQYPGGVPDQDAGQLEYANGSLRYEVQVKYNNKEWEGLFQSDGALVCQEEGDHE